MVLGMMSWCNSLVSVEEYQGSKNIGIVERKPSHVPVIIHSSCMTLVIFYNWDNLNSANSEKLRQKST